MFIEDTTHAFVGIGYAEKNGSAYWSFLFADSDSEQC
jgi:hypothetical protein